MQQQLNTFTVHKEALGLRKQPMVFGHLRYPLIILLVSIMRLTLTFPQFCDSYNFIINIDFETHKTSF